MDRLELCEGGAMFQSIYAKMQTLGAILKVERLQLNMTLALKGFEDLSFLCHHDSSRGEGQGLKLH